MDCSAILISYANWTVGLLEPLPIRSTMEILAEGASSIVSREPEDKSKLVESTTCATGIHQAQLQSSWNDAPVIKIATEL